MIDPKKVTARLIKISTEYPSLFCVEGNKNKPDKCREYLFLNALRKAYEFGRATEKEIAK